MIVGILIFSLSFVLVVCWSGKGTFDFYPGRFLYLLAFNDLTTEKIFRAVFQLVFVIFPMSLSIICCWKVYKIVKEHNTTVMANFNGVTTGNHSKFSRKEIDITKSLLALVCGFIFCWLPCTTIFHLAVYVNLPRSVEVFSIYTAFSSCAVNPIVLNIFNRPFRRQFTEIFFSARMRNEVAVEQGPTTY
jgi:melatonin receptor type 1B